MTTTQEQSWENAGQNHLPPRGDISDLVTARGQEGAQLSGEAGVDGVVAKSKAERLSNGFSSHEAALDKEEEDMEVTSSLTSAGAVTNGDSRRDGEMREREAGEAEKRISKGSTSEDELRQSVGSATSSEFNPSTFGGSHEEEVRQNREEGHGEWSAKDTGAAAAEDSTPYQVLAYAIISVVQSKTNCM